MAKGMDSREQTYQDNQRRWGTWTASAMDGWMCPTTGWTVDGVTHTCDGKHKAGDCAVARAMGAEWAARNRKV